MINRLDATPKIKTDIADIHLIVAVLTITIIDPH
jgi:hypothetical protein